MSNVFMILLHFYHELNRVIASCYSYKSSDNFVMLQHDRCPAKHK